MLQLHDYKYKPTCHVGKPKCDKVLEFRYKHQNYEYRVEVELDYQNVAIIYLYELDDVTLKYVGDSGNNLYLVFKRITITEKELIEYCNEWILSIADNIFNDQATIYTEEGLSAKELHEKQAFLRQI